MTISKGSRLLVAVAVIGTASFAGFAGAGDGSAAADAARPDTKGSCPAMAANASAVQKFRAVDQDGDGALSRAEVEGRLPGLAGRFAALDLDGDGRLTSFEIHHDGHADWRRGAKPAAFETKTIAL